MPELPTGTVTFLFSDLEGSTRLWEEHPEDMQAALARHDAILRAAVERHDGHVVETTGDGLHAVFATADRAVAAAVDGQGGLGDLEGPEGALRVRMGLHTGVAEHRDGDYFGPAVNRAARVAAAAHGGQILVSHATEELVADGTPDVVALRDLGEHRLRDLTRPERLYQLAAPGLADDFPPVRSVDAYPGNLPVQLTSFIGRESELREVSKALEEARLVTLTGTGGVGKTRLAIQIAAAALPSFPDGAWLCELASADSRDSMLQVVTAALGANPRPGHSLEASIGEFLRGKRLLLVLDNCEHLLADCGGLAATLLQHCPGIRILATSREGLGVAGEQVWPLRSLPVPTAGAEGTDISADDAVRLFLDRAHSARSTFELDSMNALAVAEICRRLDGIPLAIELAAARVVALSPAEIAARLDERFRLLGGGRRSAMERHQTLRAAVDWSYSLLTEQEQLVFDRLSVFSGTFDVAAAEEVVAGEGIEAWDVVDALVSLVSKSMVVAEDAEGGTRYQLLETMRQYARERLDEVGDPDPWRRRHADHCAALAERIRPLLEGRDEIAWRRRLNAEIDNLRAAVTWALDRGAPDEELAVRIVANLAYESYRNRATGIGAWATRSVDAARRCEPALRHSVLGAAGWNAFSLGHGDEARDLAEEAMRGGVPRGCPTPCAAIQTLAVVRSFTGDFDAAAHVFCDSHDVIEEAGATPRDHVILHAGAAAMFAVAGDREQSRAEAERAARLAREIGNPAALASALFALAQATSSTDPARALAATEEALSLARVGASTQVYGLCLTLAALLHQQLGHPREALASIDEAIRYGHASGDRSQLTGAIDSAATLVASLDRLEAAAVLAAVVTVGNLAGFGALTAEHRAARRTVLDRARAELAEDVYEAAVARGAALSDEEVIAYALAEVERAHAALA